MFLDLFRRGLGDASRWRVKMRLQELYGAECVSISTVTSPDWDALVRLAYRASCTSPKLPQHDPCSQRGPAGRGGVWRLTNRSLLKTQSSIC
jgi:hypothetical protein